MKCAGEGGPAGNAEALRKHLPPLGVAIWIWTPRSYSGPAGARGNLRIGSSLGPARRFGALGCLSAGSRKGGLERVFGRPWELRGWLDAAGANSREHPFPCLLVVTSADFTCVTLARNKRARSSSPEASRRASTRSDGAGAGAAPAAVQTWASVEVPTRPWQLPNRDAILASPGPVKYAPARNQPCRLWRAA